MIKQYIKQAFEDDRGEQAVERDLDTRYRLGHLHDHVIVILYVVNTASFKPEVNRGRTCYITTVMSNGKDDNRRISYSSLDCPWSKECVLIR